MTDSSRAGGIPLPHIFRPASIRVIQSHRKALKKSIKVARHTLEFTGEEFEGSITFRLPKHLPCDRQDAFTICAELAQEDLGIRATVETWQLREIGEIFVALQPWDFELQEEDRCTAPPMSTREFAAMVRPSEGWGR